MDSLPNNLAGLWFSAILYVDLEMYDKAQSLLQKRIELMGEDNISDEVGVLSYIYSKIGQTDKAKAQNNLLDKLCSEGYYVDTRTRVWIHLGLNEVDKAIEVIKKSIDEHTFSPGFLRLYPREYVENNTQFIKLQKDIGLIQ